MGFRFIIIIVSVSFWLIISGIIIRTNRLIYSPVSFRWSTLTQPNATFRWATAPASRVVTIPAQSKRSFKVTVPRRFSRGEVVIATAPGQGVLSADINAPVGKTNSVGSTPAGRIMTLPLVWENIAIQTRTFNVDLTTDAHEVTIQDITMSLTP